MLIGISIPYYKIRLIMPEKRQVHYIEANISPYLPTLLRASLLSPKPKGIQPYPHGDFPKVDPEPWPLVKSSLEESLTKILTGEERKIAPFQFEGIKGIIKTIVSLGRYKGYKPTIGLIAQTAYNYVHDILGITNPPKLELISTEWRPIKILINKKSNKFYIEKIFFIENGHENLDPVLTRLTRNYQEAFNNLLNKILQIINQ